MAVIPGLEWTFDAVARQYAGMRPSYPEELYDALFAYQPVDSASEVLEIGIGGGQATAPVLRTGCGLTAVELGVKLSALCRETFRDYPRFTVRTGRFEELPLASEQYDLVYAASSFHWIPEAVGYEKVFRILKPGGCFARFANHPYEDKSRQALSDRIQELYAIYMPGNPKPPEFGEEQARARAELALDYGFTDVRHMLFHRKRSFTSQSYVALLGTYSDHIALEPTHRAAFFAEIEREIREAGDCFTLHDTLELELARKP